jgi:hypothetical protein
MAPRRCVADATTLTIPASVTCAGYYSFRGATKVQAINFAPGSRLTKIRSGALRGCPSLKSICFPASLAILPSHLFIDPDQPSDQHHVETVTFEPGSKLREIEDLAFLGCDCLKRFRIPASVEKIYGMSFGDCGLETIEIESGNKCYQISDSFITDLTGTQIIRYFGRASEVEIPDNIEIIGTESFFCCRSIHQILFGANSRLRLIESCAFEECDELESICIPRLVSEIGVQAFSSMSTVSFCVDSQLTRIPRCAFEGSYLESIALPLSVEIIETCGFLRCARLVTVTVPAGSKLVRIEKQAFSRCSSLGQLCLPPSLEYVGENCFEGCDSMSTLEFSTACHLRELLDLPPKWSGLREIPDSVEILRLPSLGMRPKWEPWDALHAVFGPPKGNAEPSEYALNFGRESKLTKVLTCTPRSLLRMSSRSLKILRSDMEFRQYFWARYS